MADFGGDSISWAPEFPGDESRDPEVTLPEPSPGEITQLLNDWKLGHADAFEQLMPVVYSQLRSIAAAHLRRDHGAPTLQATALVHELYLRLLRQRKAEWSDRAHFFTFAAKLMRMILIDHARTRLADKRGGHLGRVPLSDQMAWIDVGGADMLDLDRALAELDEIDPRKVRIVELHYLLGCTIDEAAELVQVSTATVERDLKTVKAWLYRRLRAPESPGV
ncbi:MAG: sigma-70 family RNA polymerase sigma factor [Bryobacteraceae bacterium]